MSLGCICRHLSVLLWACFTINAHGNVISKIVTIDTVSGDYKSLRIAVNISPSDSFAEVLSKESDSTSLHFRVYGDSANHLMLSIDNSKSDYSSAQSFLEIENAFSSPADTIHIAHLHIYKNCLPDSGVMTSYYYKHFKSPERPLKLLSTKRHSNVRIKACNDLPPTTIELSINGKLYTTKVEVLAGASVHIYHPTTKHQRALKERGKTYKYRYVNTSFYYTMLVAKIVLN